MTFFSMLERKNGSQLVTEQLFPLPAFCFTTGPHFCLMSSQLILVSIALSPSLLSLTLRKTKPQVWGPILSVLHSSSGAGVLLDFMV